MTKWLCKLIGHKFGGYEITKDGNGNPIQAMPNKFYCLRCKCITHVCEEWD